jgi:transcription initiation factor IIE alpha subunit
MNGNGNVMAKVVDMISLLTKADRTSAELAELTGMNAQTVRIWMRALHSEGVVEVIGTRKTPGKLGHLRRPANVFRWVR